MDLKNSSVRVPRLGRNRFGVFYVRIRQSHPDDDCDHDVAHRRPVRVRQFSLQTKDPALAKHLALRLAILLLEGYRVPDLDRLKQSYEIDLRSGVIKADGPEDHERAMQAMQAMREVGGVLYAQQLIEKNYSAPAQAAAVSSPPAAFGPEDAATAAAAGGVKIRKRLSKALEEHLAQEVRRLKPGSATHKEKRSIFKEFADFFGDVHVHEITDVDIVERWRPAEFQRPNGKLANHQTSVARLEKRRGYLKKFFDWAAEALCYPKGANPMAAKMANKKQIRQQERPYVEFNADDLKKLFTHRYRDEMTAPDWYWTPLIALFTGARLSEIAHRRLEDFELIEGRWCMHIKHSKTPEGRRTVPLHSALVDLGLIRYIEALRQRGFERLFPHRPEDKPEKMVGRMWSEWIKRCGLQGQNKTFHSLRSTAITELHGAKGHHAPIHRISGHVTQGVSGAHGHYVRLIAVPLLAETVELMRYNGLDLNVIRRQDPTFAAFFNAAVQKQKTARVRVPPAGKSAKS
jgi:integrase